MIPVPLASALSFTGAWRCGPLGVSPAISLWDSERPSEMIMTLSFTNDSTSLLCLLLFYALLSRFNELYTFMSMKTSSPSPARLTMSQRTLPTLGFWNFLNRPVRPYGNQHVCSDSSFSRRVTLLVDVSAHFSNPLCSVTLITSLDVVSAVSPPCRDVATNHGHQSFRAELEEFLFGFPNHSWWWLAFTFYSAMYFWHHYLTIRFKKEKHHSYKLSQLLHSFLLFF